jgi:hypothetical protein
VRRVFEATDTPNVGADNIGPLPDLVAASGGRICRDHLGRPALTSYAIDDKSLVLRPIAALAAVLHLPMWR